MPDRSLQIGSALAMNATTISDNVSWTPMNATFVPATYYTASNLDQL